jgi:TPP-dependent pyruvate/acetoin dehydrogenase alpha subunit
LADEAGLDAIAQEVNTEIEHGVSFALAAPFPDPSEVTDDVFA